MRLRWSNLPYPLNRDARISEAVPPLSILYCERIHDPKRYRLQLRASMPDCTHIGVRLFVLLAISPDFERDPDLALGINPVGLARIDI